MFLDDSKVLDLSNNVLTLRGTKALAAAATHCTSLTSLDLSWSEIGGIAGAKAVAAALPRSRLATLELAGNEIGLNGARALALALPHAPQLTSLDLSNSNVRDDGARAVAAAAAGPGAAVTTLNLTEADLSDAAEVELCAAYPRIVRV